MAGQSVGFHRHDPLFHHDHPDHEKSVRKASHPEQHHIDEKEREATATVVVDGRAKYPMPDKAHARSALARIDQAKPPLTSEQKSKVENRAHRILDEGQ
jgi:hypothetical protein